MEYNQTLSHVGSTWTARSVLILVLMEYNQTCPSQRTTFYIPRLNPCSNGIQSNCIECFERKHRICLNPCSNGIQSNFCPVIANVLLMKCLNPCSNGIQSNLYENGKRIPGYKSLNPCSNGIQSNCSGSDLDGNQRVLILVLMEYNQTP